MNKDELEDSLDEESPCTEGYEHSCIYATSHPSECTCNCGGVNHGKGLKPVTKEQQKAVIKAILEGRND